MIEKMAKKMVVEMIRESWISKENEAEYVYALTVFAERLITVGSMLLLSIVLHSVLVSLVFLTGFFALRRRTGGFHAKTFFQCYLGTIASYVGILLMNTYMINIPDEWTCLCLLIATILIMILGTVNHPNMNMNKAEFVESKKAARWLLTLEVCIVIGLKFLSVDARYINALICAIVLCALLLILAKILKQEVKTNGKNSEA